MPNWVLKQTINGELTETKFSSFEQANIAFRNAIKSDIEEVCEMLFTYGSDDEEAQEVYTAVKDFLTKFISNPQFPYNTKFDTIFCDDNFYNIIISEAFLSIQKSECEDLFDIPEVFDDEGNVLKEPILGPYLVLRFLKTESDGCECCFEVTKYDNTNTYELIQL